MMRKIAITISILLMPLTAQAYEWGIGAHILSPEAIIFPININDELRIEPMIGSSSGPSYSFLGLGIGVFKLMPVKDNVQTYYGAHVSMYTTPSYDLYALAPTIGIEYFFSKRFSVGVESGVSYGKYVGGSNDGKESINTFATTMVRFYP